MNTIKEKINLLIKKIKLSKLNFLNHKFKKYIIKYEEDENNIIIYNSNGDKKIVKNNIPNKVKIMEIIKDHNTEINKKINYYKSKKEDYKIIILSSGILLLMFGFMFIFSFFTGSYILLILTLLSFSICLYLYLEYVYKVLLFREEIKRLVYIKEEHEINYDDNELKEIAIDSFKVVRNKFYSGLEKIIDILDKKQKI